MQGLLEIEANEALSKKDLRMRIKISRKGIQGERLSLVTAEKGVWCFLDLVGRRHSGVLEHHSAQGMPGPPVRLR